MLDTLPEAVASGRFACLNRDIDSSMTLTPDDTRPKSPLKADNAAGDTAHDTNPNLPRLISPEEDDASGPGCLVWGFISAVLIGSALIVVGLSATAGWTAGQRVAQANATATYQSEIDVQLGQMASDAALGNVSMYDIRFRFLASQTPGIPQVPALAQTGTALYIAHQPTSTPSPTPTTEQIAPTVESTVESAEPTSTPPSDDPYNLAGRLENARRAVGAAQWETAIEELDIILRVDPQYGGAAAQSLMREALNKQAQRLYQTGDPSNLAEANRLTTRAEENFPPLLVEGLSFERTVATYYLDALSYIGTSDYGKAITNLEQVVSLASQGYLNGEPRRQLARAYSQLADAQLMTQACVAVTNYDNALRYINDPTISGKRITAQNYCDFGTPTPEGFVATVDPANPGGAITPAPIGQPGG